MDKIPKNWIYIVLVIFALLFYWFQIRPSNILKYCQDKMTSPETAALIITSEFERNQLNRDMVKINAIEREKETFYFNQCLHEKGLK